MTSFESLLTELARHEVRFIVVGGAAAIAHGSTRLTQDLDIVYDRSTDNLERLVIALASYQPYLLVRRRACPSCGMMQRLNVV